MFHYLKENYYYWIRTKYNKLNLTDKDIIIITDLDEIPNPNTLLQIKNNNIHIDINILELDFYYYNLNTGLSVANNFLFALQKDVIMI